jgi:hypothetical protein
MTGYSIKTHPVFVMPDESVVRVGLQHVLTSHLLDDGLRADGNVCRGVAA